MSTEIILEEEKSYKVVCQYKNTNQSTDVVYGPKDYTFCSYTEHVPGELVVVKDASGYSLVKVKSCESQLFTPGSHWASVVDLNEINGEAKVAYRRDRMQKKIREALIQDIEKNAFERLASSHPELKETLDEFKQLGGSYTELMPSIKNLIEDYR